MYSKYNEMYIDFEVCDVGMYVCFIVLLFSYVYMDF